MKGKSFKSDYASLNKQQVEEIFIELREGTTYREIAKMFSVSLKTIQNINTGKYLRIPGMRYPIVDRRRKINKEPDETSFFWDSYVPPPELLWPK
tara:strand:- start:376 stop:660 length:285 start_codon:yes stop_codon:yes gene_type:complete